MGNGSYSNAVEFHPGKFFLFESVEAMFDQSKLVEERGWSSGVWDVWYGTKFGTVLVDSNAVEEVVSHLGVDFVTGRGCQKILQVAESS